ncbi:unnamed protein product [Adineta ricciae]|uniref:Acyl-coenzyme A oxidase n=1 Tax=Adineta ricciae TaxID=249248 RepID=A0A815T5P0_ADIRI|nr:unnamed protein product [Adineta ricciae]
MPEYADAKPHYRINDTKNIHLLAERQSSTFDVEDFAQFMFGGSDNPFDINTRRQLSFVEVHLFFEYNLSFCLARLAITHPIHQTHLPFEYLTADEHYSLCIRKSFAAIDAVNRLNITNRKHRGWFYEIFVNYYFSFYIHTSMCIYAIENLASEEQKHTLLPLAESFQIIATYAQTELGHGTDIRRLETEAIFDKTTDSFILNTPTLTATKFWPGSMGKTVNHVLLMAQLYTPDSNHACGVQMFLVQIRDLKTHQPLPGVEVGEISTRFAHIFGDNGYLRLTNVRIPRTQMFMKLAHVDSNGNFTRQGDARLLYGTMVHERLRLINTTLIALIRAMAIAVRYSAVRFQGLNPSGKETRILDYPLQQEKLIPSLSTTYAFLIAFIKLDRYFFQLKTNDDDYFRELPQLHALSCGFKGYTLSISERIAQICRVACGGHGFLVASGLVTSRNGIDGGCSAEGDNVVLLQQTARYLLKRMQQVEENNSGSLHSSVAYLNLPLWLPPTSLKLDDYCRLFESRSQLLVKEMFGKMLESTSSSPYDAFIQNSIELVHMAKAHMETFIIRAFYDQVQNARQHVSIALVLEQLFYVYAIHTLRNTSTDFVRLKLLSADQIYELESRVLPDLYIQLRPNLVTLVDAFDFHDFELDSCLGRYDGQVYEALMERARLNPSNRHKVPPIWTSIKQGTLSKL